jgi:hypothetical protein
VGNGGEVLASTTPRPLYSKPHTLHCVALVSQPCMTATVVTSLHLPQPHSVYTYKNRHCTRICNFNHTDSSDETGAITDACMTASLRVTAADQHCKLCSTVSKKVTC